MKNQLVKKYGAEKRWVNYKIEVRKGKKTKIPYSPHTSEMARSTDSRDWGTFDEAKKRSPDVGIIFTPAQDLLGIDIDHCLKDKKIDHEQKEQIANLILEADTYTEISPSGEGLHLFLGLSDPLRLASNKSAPFECYTSGRYFTVTGNAYGEQKEVRTVSSEEALKILALIDYPWKEISTQSPKLSTVSAELNDEDILQKMFASKNGEKVKEVYAKKAGNSEDDMSLCSHLAFWTGRDPVQMERLWLASPLGSRKKTQQRKDYRDRTIRNAINSTKEVYEPSPVLKAKSLVRKLDLDLLYTLDSKGNKIYTQNTENMCRILDRHPDFAGRFRFDTFKNIFQIKDGQWRNLEDNDAVRIQTQIQIIFPLFGKVGKDMIYDAIIKVSKDHAIDSAIQYVKSLKWDGVARLDSWLSKTYGTPDDKYHKAVGSNWLKGIVKRIIEPGCKFDYVLVLEGPQGTRKSMSLSILGGDWYVETTMSTESKDFFMQFAGNIIIEFSEGETLNRTEVKRMKAIITTQTDKYRPAYGRAVVEFPRRCVFAMTTNDEEYLKDETGNRRWLPVKMIFDNADTDWLKANRDQLFAEAYQRLTVGKENVYELPREEVLQEQNARKVHYEHEDEIVYWYEHVLDDEKRANGITVHQVYKDALGNTFNKMLSKSDEIKIANTLKDVLKLKRERMMINRVRMWRWTNSLVPVKSEITVDDFDL